MLKLVFLACCVAICGVIGRELPSNFLKCKRDANFDDCLKDAIQDSLSKLPNGLPEFKMPPVDPLSVEKMTIQAGSGPVQVEQNFNDVKIHGITKALIKSVKANVTEPDVEIVVDTFVEKLFFKANYNLDGKILILPIVGTGKCTIALNKLTTLITLIGKVEEKKGKMYVHVKEVQIKLKPAHVSFNFENLFNGDKRLGDQINNVLNENQKEVFEDVRTGYEEFLGIVIMNVANQIFLQVPFEQLFLSAK